VVEDVDRLDHVETAVHQEVVSKSSCSSAKSGYADAVDVLKRKRYGERRPNAHWFQALESCAKAEEE